MYKKSRLSRQGRQAGQEGQDMNIYIDESGSINNRAPHSKYFVIALLCVKNRESLKRSYKRFVSSNFDILLKLDQRKSSPGDKRPSKGKMFSDGKFRELKGSQFDREMKIKFVEFFSRKPVFELFYIKIVNKRLTDLFCENTARVFNYALRLALDFFIRNGYLPDEDCCLQLDERNEKTESRFFLENYLNTELSMNGTATGHFQALYFDSVGNDLVQLADVFANLYYSYLLTGHYENEIRLLQDAGILKFVFEFPKSKKEY